MKQWLLNRWLKQMSYEDLRELVAQAHPDKHLSYDPKKAPPKVKKEKKRKEGITTMVQDC